MSLTSYRAAPPRVKRHRVRPEPDGDEGSLRGLRHPFCRPGGDLLSRALRRSTIGPGRLNDRVRNGIGWGPSGIATRSTKRMNEKTSQSRAKALMSLTKNDQADRAISTGKLHALPHFHTRPINVVVFHDSQGILVSRWVSRLDAFSGYPVHT